MLQQEQWLLVNIIRLCLYTLCLKAETIPSPGKVVGWRGQISNMCLSLCGEKRKHLISYCFFYVLIQVFFYITRTKSVIVPNFIEHIFQVQSGCSIQSLKMTHLLWTVSFICPMSRLGRCDEWNENNVEYKDGDFVGKKLFSDRKMKCLGLVTLISHGKAV